MRFVIWSNRAGMLNCYHSSDCKVRDENTNVEKDLCQNSEVRRVKETRLGLQRKSDMLTGL